MHRQRVLLTITAAACLGMTLWIVWLAGALPSHHAVRQWRTVWIGFDALELAAAAATGWAASTGRRWAPNAAIVTGTLFLSDAWFDIALCWGSPGETASLGLALLLELPLTLGLWALARRLAPPRA